MKQQCVQPCAAVESMLPPVERARLHQLHQFGALENARRIYEGMRDARTLTDYRDEFTGRIRQVFDMYYNQFMTHEEIAFALNIDRRTAGRYIERACAIVSRRVMGGPTDGRKARQ